MLRTTPLLTAYHRKYPDCHITWVVDASSAPVLKDNPFIHSLLVYSEDTLKELAQTTFDLAINLDKEKEALDTMQAAGAKERLGYGWDTDHKALMALNRASEYAVRLGRDDELKFRKNTLTYQQISYEQAELPFQNDPYIFPVSEIANR